jgi:hypothetical protein
VPAKKPTPPSQPCLSRKESCAEGVPGTFLINTELSRGKRGGGKSQKNQKPKNRRKIQKSKKPKNRWEDPVTKEKKQRVI